MRPCLAATIRIVLCLCLGLQVQAAQAPTDPLEPAGTGGVEAVDRALAKLSTHQRLLVIAAHPDDEDTSLLSLVSRGMGGEAAYLSLSRGEGGQNLIGPELGVGLGILRSRELLAARKIDGARQFFSRAYDFGYTRSLDETLERWPREVLAEDVARIVRRFRPQVVMSVFPGQPVATHGQHQAAGVVAHEVFPVVGRTGEDDAFPELTAQGLPPWQPKALYRSTWFDPDSTDLTLSTGQVDPLTGHSIFQVAMAGRSQHRSQDMGVLQPLGSTETSLGWVEGGNGEDARDLFAGIDTGLAALASTLPEGDARTRVREYLGRVEAKARWARDALVPAELSTIVPAFVDMIRDLEAAGRLLDRLGDGEGLKPVEARAVRRLLDEKLQAARGGLAAAAGLAVDAVSDRSGLVAGETVSFTTQLWASGDRSVELEKVELILPSGWTAEPTEAEEPDGFFARRWGPRPTVGTSGTVGAGELAEGTFAVTVAEDAVPSRPYFLRAPLRGDLYDWSDVDPELRGEPFGPPPARVRFHVKLEGVHVPLEREVVYRSRDQIQGEVRKPLRVVPALDVAVEPDLAVWSTRTQAKHPLEVTLTRHSTADLSGRVEVRMPAGWPRVEPVPFRISGDAHAETLEIELLPPPDLTPGRHRVAVEAVLDGGRRFNLGVPLVDYEHVRSTPRPVPATLDVSATDLRLPDLERVGYVRGASDRVPEMLERIGVSLEILDSRDLAQGDLSRYDAVVVGSRAYETDPALVKANSRLLDYARAGGLLVVQYQQYQFARGGFAPYPLDISRPHDRVTDETAPMTALDPEHPAFRVPNPIGPADWDGWVQERGLYFAGTWDDAYTPLLETADPGGEPLRGSLLVASLGEGTYVYTGLAFFRQLPAGVPGAYRLFANLLALGSDARSTL